MSMRKIYRKIARENGVSVKEVKSEMQLAITEAYNNTPNDGGVIAAYQRKIPRKAEIPTPDELIKYISKKVETSK